MVRVERRGGVLGVVDGLIAATALHHGHTVVTRNVADFAGTGVPVLNVWVRIGRGTRTRSTAQMLMPSSRAAATLTPASRGPDVDLYG